MSANLQTAAGGSSGTSTYDFGKQIADVNYWYGSHIGDMFVSNSDWTSWQSLGLQVEVPDEMMTLGSPVKIKGTFDLMVPKADAETGATVFNWISWTDTNNDAKDTYAVGCAATLDIENNKNKVRVTNYKGTDFSSWTANNWADKAFADLDKEQGFRPKREKWFNHAKDLPEYEKNKNAAATNTRRRRRLQNFNMDPNGATNNSGASFGTDLNDAMNAANDAMNGATDAMNAAGDAMNGATDAMNAAGDAMNQANDAMNQATDMANAAANGTIDLNSTPMQAVYAMMMPEIMSADYTMVDVGMLCSNFKKEAMIFGFWTICKSDLKNLCSNSPDSCTDQRFLPGNISQLANMPSDSPGLVNGCAQDIYTCMKPMEANFCEQFPGLCPNIQQQPFQNYGDFMGAVCNGNQDFCNGDPNGDLDFGHFCDNFGQLAADYIWQSSVITMCLANTKPLCEDEPYANVICPNQQLDMGDLCPLYNGQYSTLDGNPLPDKCNQAASDTYDECASDPFNCLVRTNYNWCVSFPDLCISGEDILKSLTGGGNYSPEDLKKMWEEGHLIDVVCKVGDGKYCNDQKTGIKVVDFCDNFMSKDGDDWMMLGFSGAWTLCRSNVYEQCASNSDLCDDQLYLKADICAALTSSSIGSEADSDGNIPCTDALEALKHYDSDFCYLFGELCTTYDGNNPQPITDYAYLQSEMCALQSDLCINNEVSWHMVCDSFSELNAMYKWTTSLGSICRIKADRLCEEDPFVNTICTQVDVYHNGETDHNDANQDGQTDPNAATQGGQTDPNAANQNGQTDPNASTQGGQTDTNADGSPSTTTVQFISDNLCALYNGQNAINGTTLPNKCDQANAANDYNVCAESWRECMTRPNWNFCGDFPELCMSYDDFYNMMADMMNDTDHHNDTDHYNDHDMPDFTEDWSLQNFTSWDAMETELCKQQGLCYEDANNQKKLNLREFCDYKIHEADYQIFGSSAIPMLCWSADWYMMCEAEREGGYGLCDPQTKDFVNDFCADQSKEYIQEMFCGADVPQETKTCVSDFRTCLLDGSKDLCQLMPEFCYYYNAGPAEEDKITEIQDWERIDYGAPFFMSPPPAMSPSINYVEQDYVYINCQFELIEPVYIAEKIMKTQALERGLFFDDGMQYTPDVVSGARVWPKPTNGVASTSSKELIAPAKSRAMLNYPWLENAGTFGGMETASDKAADEEFEKSLKGDAAADVGSIIHIGGNTDFNMVYLDGPNSPPYDVIYDAQCSFAVVNENGNESVYIGFEFSTEFPSAIFMPQDDQGNDRNVPDSIDNWVRFAKMNETTGELLGSPASSVVCSQGNDKDLAVNTYTFADFDNGFNRQASAQSDQGQVFGHKEQEFPDAYGLYEEEDLAIVRCMAVLQVDPNDDNLYGSYYVQSGTTFYMIDQTEYEMSTTDWFVELTQDKTKPPKKEFELQGSVKYKKDSESISFGVDIGYEITQDLDTDNALMLVFTAKDTDIASSGFQETDYVGVFLKYRKKGEWGETRYVSCGTKKGDDIEGKEFKDYHPDVNNFLSWLDKSDGVKQMVYLPEDPQSIADPDTQELAYSRFHDAWDTMDNHFFYASDDPHAHMFKIEGNEAEARCIAVMYLPKFNEGSTEFIGEEILGEYDVEVGLFVGTEGQADPKISKRYNSKKTITLKAPTYDETILEEVSKHSDVHSDMFMESGRLPIDQQTSPAFANSQAIGEAYIEMKGEMKVNSDPNAPPVIRLIINSQTPYVQGDYVYRHLLRLKNMDAWDQDDLVVGCEVDAKDPKKHGVVQFKSDYDLRNPDAKLLTGKDFLVPKEGKVVMVDPDKTSYKAKSDAATNTVTTQCVITITYDDRVKELASELFDAFYEGKLGLQLFNKKATSAPYSTNAAWSDTYAYLPVPYYDTTEHKDEAKPAAAFFRQDFGLQKDNDDAIGFGYLEFMWEISPDFKMPDVLTTTIFATFDKTVDTPDTKAFVYFEIWPSYLRGDSPARMVGGCAIDMAQNEVHPMHQEGVTVEFDMQTAMDAQQTASQQDYSWVKAASSSAGIFAEIPNDKNLFANCTLTTDIAKKDRDYTLFQEYKGAVGAAIDKSAQIQDLGRTEFSFKLEEPVYDFGEETASDYIWQPLDFKYKELNAGDFDQNLQNQWGEMSFSTDYKLSPYFHRDDALVANFNVWLPSSLLPQDAWVFYYFQLQNKDMPKDEYITVGCSVQVKNPGNQQVTEWQGSSKFKGNKVTGQKIFEQHASEVNTETSWTTSKDSWMYETWEDDFGMTTQPCAAELTIYKKDPDESIYNTWKGRGGVRIYKSADATTFMDLGSTKLTFIVEKPNYEADIPDPTEFAEFEDMIATEDEDLESQPLDSLSAEIDLSNMNLGFTGKIKQKVLAKFQISDDIGEPDFIELLYQADMPRDALPESAIIYQWAQFTPKTDQSFQEYSVDCIVMVGNPDGVFSAIFEGKLDDSAAGGKDMFSINSNFHTTYWPQYIDTYENMNFFELQKSDTDFKNEVQNCLAKISIPKENRDVKLFQEYDVKYGVRIYSDFEDSNPVNPGEQTTTMSITAPKYKAAEFDEEEGIPEDIEQRYTPKKQASKDCDAAALESTFGTAVTTTNTVKASVDYIELKSSSMPDVIEINTEVDIQSDLVADGELIATYVNIGSASSTALGANNMFICVAKKGDPAAATIYSGSNGGSFTSQNWSGKKVNEGDTFTEADEKFRKNFGEEPYAQESANGVDKIKCSAQFDVNDKMDSTKFDDYFQNDFKVTYGAAKFADENDTSGKPIGDGAEETFELAKPDYKFGDAFEFNEEPKPVDGFKQTLPFQMSDYDATFTGKGFVKMIGDFKMVPNFESLFWQFTFSLEMPKQYFDDNKYAFFYATYEPTDQSDDPVTVSCEVKINDPISAKVVEYDQNFSFDPNNAQARISEINAANVAADGGSYDRNYDPKLYSKVDSIGGKARQSCSAVTEIMPWDADAIQGKEYTIKDFGAYMYDDDQLSSTHTAGIKATKAVNYKMPTIDGGFETLMKPIEDTVMERQLLSFQENSMAASSVKESTEGQIKQTVTTGFEFNPTLDTAHDKLVFNFDLETPAALAAKGSRIMQYVTFSNPSDTKSKPTTVGCTTQVGDPYVSNILTWKGVKKMDGTSTVVKDKTYDNQNQKEKAKKKDSFKLIQEAAWYRTDEYTEGNTQMYYQPCIATLDMGKKMEASDSFFANYDVEFGTRIYNDDYSKTFTQIPSKKTKVEIKMPNTDLASLYEEQQPETSAETVEYFDEVFKFKLADMQGDSTPGRGFQRARGGYKLYGDANAKDRWYFNLALELPEALFVNDEILYQWISYEFDQANSHLNGAASCKIQVGDLGKTSSDQWSGLVNLESTDKEVAGKKWYKQQPNNKLKESQYNAMWWNEDTFQLKDSTRSIGGYKIQECEIETVLDKSAIPDDTFVTLKMGARIYADNNSKSFKTTKEATFEWFRQQMTYTPELEIPATYDETAMQFKVDAEAVSEVDLSTSSLGPRIQEAQAAIDAAAAQNNNNDSNDANDANDANANNDANNNADPNANVDPNAQANGGRVILKAPSAKSELGNAKQTIQNGYKLFEKINESDWWWWWIALEISDSLVQTDEVLYQFVTVTDPNDNDASFTVGCKTKVGTDGEVLQYFSHDANSPDQLKSDSSVVTSQTWLAQAGDLKEEADDISWSAGTTHVPEASRPAASTTADFTKHVCYFYEELKKIGRNPKDFDKDLNLTFGARIYADDNATTFLSIPESTSSIKKGALPTYVSAAVETETTQTNSNTPSGAPELVMSLASLFMLFFSLVY